MARWRRFAGLLGPPIILIIAVGALYAHYGELPALRCRLTGVAAAAAGLMLATVAKMARPLFRMPSKNPAVIAPLTALATFVAIGILHLAAAARSAGDRASEHRRRLSQRRNAAMKSESGSLITLAAFFAVTSLFAVSGGNSVIPEMHRYAVDIQHWLTDREFADSFTLAQLTPGPNLIIVTLDRLPRRRHCRCGGGDAGDVRPDLGAGLYRRPRLRALRGAAWHGALTRGLVPVTLGLTAASATVIVSVADYSWVAATITLATAYIALFMRVHPLWAFAAAALLGLAGLV